MNNIIILINIFIYNLNNIFNVKHTLTNFLKRYKLIKKMKNYINRDDYNKRFKTI